MQRLVDIEKVAGRLRYLYKKWAYAVGLKEREFKLWSREMAGLGYSVAVEEGANSYEQDRGPFRNFVFLKARLLAVRSLESRGRHLKAVESLTLEQPVSPPPSDELESFLLRSELRSILETLTPLDRQVLCLRYVYDLKPNDIAIRLGRPVNSIYSTIRRALEKARKLAEETGLGPEKGPHS